MSERDPSRTALGTAYLRAAHQLLDAEPRVLEGPVAVPLLGPGAARRIHARAADHQADAWRVLRAHVVLRSRFAEDRLAGAAARGVTQYVVLGAGYDTFALRQPDWARALRIFELDHGGTQAEKRRLMAAAGIVLPGTATFVGVDFAREPLRDALRRGGVALDEPSFFSWLGVTMYLEEAAVDAVLGSVAAFPAGSEIVLTFAQPPGDSPSPFERTAAGVGEPWVSHFEPDALAAKLRGAGFSQVGFLSPAEAGARYFAPRPPDLPTPRRVSIGHAIV